MSLLEPPYHFILNGLQNGQVIPFLGAGASLSGRGTNTNWSSDTEQVLPSGAELAAFLAKISNFPSDESLDLAKVAQYFEVSIGRDRLREHLRRVFLLGCPSPSPHKFLAGLPVPLIIITTNYDDLMEQALTERGVCYDVVVHTTETSMGGHVLWWKHGEPEPHRVLPKNLDIEIGQKTVVYKMHGGIDRQNQERDQYVVTEDDYVDFMARMVSNRAIPAVFAEPFQKRHFLFLGYSLRDWNLRVVLKRIGDLRRPNSVTSWAIQRQPSELERLFWSKRSVTVYDMHLDEFIRNLDDCQNL